MRVRRSSGLAIETVLWVCSGIWGLAAPAPAQEFRATVSGVVTDASGAAVAGAQVSVVESNTNVRTGTKTEENGHYTIPFLLPGDYDLSVTASGFKEFQRKGWRLSAGENPVIDAKLEVGDAKQMVVVSADIPLINLENGSVGTTITAREVQDLPLNGGTPIMMASLAMGVISTAQPSEVQPFASGGGASWSIGGAPSQQNELLLDGVPNATWDGRLAYSPPRDAVQEVRPKVFETDAAFGHSGAGTVNQILKSGTNRVNGSAYWINKPNTLVANNFFNNKNGLAVPVTHYNQFGGTLGGPLVLPKIVNGKDKLFWFFAFEGMQLSQPGTAFMSVPTDLERQGDFSRILAAKTVIYNPYSGVLNGTVITRTAFPNNRIPASMLNPIAQNYLPYFPKPNVTTARVDDFENFGTNNITRDGFTNELGRLDWNASEKWRTYFNIRHTDYSQTKDDWYQNEATGSNLSRSNWGASMDQVYMVNAQNILNLRVNFTRMFEDHSSPSYGFDPAKLGYPSYIASSSPYLQMPSVTFATSTTGYRTLGQNGANTLPSQSLQFFGTWSGMRGSHQWKAGGDARQYRLNIANYGRSAGEMGFTANTWVRSASNASSTVAKGQDLASFVMGLPTGGSYELNSSAMYYEYYGALFVQDDWRIRRNLTLNVGVRWDRDFPYQERWARTNNGFAFNASNPLEPAATAAYAKAPSPLLPPDQFKVPGGLTFASMDDRSIYRTASMFSPRFGFAWSPERLHGKTAVRGGVGMFVSPLTIATLQPTGAYSSSPLQTQAGYSQATALTPSNDNYLTPYATLADPFPTGIVQPAGGTQGLLTFTGQAIKFLNAEMQSPYAVRWTFGFQQMLDKSTALDVVYTGNRARRIPITYTQLNGVPLNYLSTLPVRDQNTITALTATNANPFYGLQTSQSTSKTIQVNQILSKYPEFPNGNGSPGSSGVVENNQTIGTSYFNSLNVRISRRFSGGLQFTFNYMRSILIEQTSWLNPGEPELEQRVSPFDRPHRFVFGGVYELPFGKRRPVKLNAKWLDLIAGDWRMSGTYTYQVGGPFPWLNGSTNNPGDYVYLGAPLKLNNRNVDTAAFDTTAFKTLSTEQFQFHRRTFPTTFLNLRGDGTNDLNISLMKDFQLTERARFQFRCDAYNVPNHPVFAAPNTQVNNSLFGYITSQANRPRSVAFMARFMF
ncbi:MAG: carboxypeptidase regulatory-like domain-containing protein [Acidobacteria bacterium]|nr:carboxypeptidase regulatory-like domain-containing protein [Acidobacteriota bacterium]